jgi:hypothetical protein
MATITPDATVREGGRSAERAASARSSCPPMVTIDGILSERDVVRA